MGQVIAHCKAILEGTEAVYLKDISSEIVLDWLATERARDQGIGLSTANHYVRSIKSFVRWVAKRCKSRLDPLVDLGLFYAEEDVRRERRTFGLEEIYWLLTRPSRAATTSGD